MNGIWKIFYVFCRQTSWMGLPFFRDIRNFVYCRYLNAPGINVDDFVRIGPAHPIAGARSEFGCDAHISRNVEIDATGGIVMGDRVTVSEDAKIYTHAHVIDDGHIDWRLNDIRASPLVIKDDVWIGACSVILESVGEIGEGAVVAAGAVVSENVPRFAVVGGVPAKILRSRRC